MYDCKICGEPARLRWRAPGGGWWHLCDECWVTAEAQFELMAEAGRVLGERELRMLLPLQEALVRCRLLNEGLPPASLIPMGLA